MRNASILISAAFGALAAAASFASAHAEPSRGGVARFAVAEESRGLDPLTAHRRFSEAAIHIHDGLAVFDTSGKAYGALAESWEANPQVVSPDVV